MAEIVKMESEKPKVVKETAIETEKLKQRESGTSPVPKKSKQPVKAPTV